MAATTSSRPDQHHVGGGIRHARRKRLGRGTVAWIVVLALVVVGGGAYGAYTLYKQSLADNIEVIGDPFAGLDEDSRPEPAPGGADTQAVNILVLGCDSRVSGGDPSLCDGSRTDAILLVHLAADRESATVVSINRDSWVPIPGHGDAKINAAYAFGGAPLMIQTVEQLTGVRLDHFAVTDFSSFTELTDALGGVQLTLADGNGGSYHQVMNGEEALAYVRERKSLSNGDFGRVQRQQAWIRAIVAKANNNRRDPVKMTRFLEAVSNATAADPSLDLARMEQLFGEAREISTNDITFLTSPHMPCCQTSADGQSIVTVDRARLDPLMQAIANDTVDEYAAEHEGELDTLPAVVE
ncbi:LCP family protein [Myceligenerans pegani]|uniref:LCP family protein n=1 Tax=Myceligenerans pegani TaxID=2776917 RepID=A0ABR9N289_9MICO|nr:LCP family protein [Myceligenerans sp. TRM 65318]MBE1877132.1 LCP family protein [Myceligenerans sp. TRM 65318]MBE3019403.1 LCP family protein [Myceligenerans sp. TRM 65318]